MKDLPFWRRHYGACRVLDLGGGHRPVRGGTHVVEIDIADGYHREGKPLMVPDASTPIVGNVEALRVRSGMFGFILASYLPVVFTDGTCSL